MYNVVRVATNAFDMEIESVKYRVVKHRISRLICHGYKYHIYTCVNEEWDYDAPINDRVSNIIAREISAFDWSW